MANTAKGRLYSRLIRYSGKPIDDVPEIYLQDCKDSYFELFAEIIE